MKDKANRWEIGWLGGPILALRYRRAAQLDESHGLPFAAAMNWRKAAELSAWFTVLANSYWQQWERVMHLPRRLAGPIGLASARIVNTKRNSSNVRLRPLGQQQATLRHAA
jgi:hypothetical protein